MWDHFDLLAPVYDRMMGPPDPDRLKVLLGLPARGRLLDAGGGTGRIGKMLTPLVDSVVVTDPAFRMVRRAGESGNVNPVRAHVERLPFPDGAFTRALVVDAFHHFIDQEEAAQELCRVLAPGGILVIEEPDIASWQVKLAAAMEKILLMRSRFRRPATIEAMLAQYGLTTKRDHDGYYTAWIIASKKDPA